MSNKGLLIVFSGPSGAGKSTILKELFKLDENLIFSVSATTRAPRPGEAEGKNYFFVSHQKFENMIERDELLEHAGFVDNYYGTPKDYVIKKMDEGMDVVLEIEVQGAFIVKEKMPDCLMIFLLPPCEEELKARLEGRKTESTKVLNKRLAKAKEEIKLSKTYDFAVVNDDVKTAALEIRDIIQKQRELRREN